MSADMPWVAILYGKQQSHGFPHPSIFPLHVQAEKVPAAGGRGLKCWCHGNVWDCEQVGYTYSRFQDMSCVLHSQRSANAVYSVHSHHSKR
jgi:hypothetical protein